MAKYKTIYKVLYPVGFEELRVEDSFQTKVPYTEVPPLKIEENLQSQFYDFNAKKWNEAFTQDITEQLNLLETLNTAATDKISTLELQLTNQNEQLVAQDEKLIQQEKKLAVQDEEIVSTQLAVAEVYEQLAGGNA